MWRRLLQPCRLTLLASVVFVLSGLHGEARAKGTGPSGDKSVATASQAKKQDRPRKKGWRRGGINPCNTPDPGWGIYDRWSRASSMGQMIAPGKGGMTRQGGFDLLVHFHGHEPIRKEFVKAAKGIVLVGIDLGIGSGPYYQAFSSPQVFERLLESVEKEMAKRNGRKKAHVRKLGLSAWSAGYGAIEQILRQPAGKKVDAVILLDSLHTGYADAAKKTLQTHSLEPFVEFARRAVRGQRFFYHSYSSIDPPGYASTRECGRYVIKTLGGKPRKAKRNDVLGLKLFERYDRGGFHARGYRGDDKPDHCAHIGLMKSIVKVHLSRRWRTPKGRRAPFKPGEQKKAPPGGTIHVVASGQSLGGIAKRYHVSVDAIRDANGLTKGGRPIQPGDELIIPAPTGTDGQGGDSERRRTLRPGERLHVVAKGQSLGAIAKRYHVTVDDIRDANGLSRGGRKIQPGDELIIPAPGSATDKAASSPRSRKLRPGERLHVVAEGQSLGAIAKRYHVTVEAIRKANKLPKGGRKIQPGEELIIPAKQEASGKSDKPQHRPLRPGEVEHIVKSNDSLWGLAKKYDTTVDAIRKANGLREDGPPIRKGQRLVIPKGKKPEK